MKFSALASLGFATVVVADVSLSNTKDDCNSIKEKEQCLNSKGGTESCVWCECQAVPSVCVTKDQADSLPPGVFECTSPDVEFHFVEDRVHYLKENEMEQGSDFCDPASKSISGYMDIKGSKYDKNGENKHLFFWMFEKRNADLEESKEEIPFVVWLTGKLSISPSSAIPLLSCAMKMHRDVPFRWLLDWLVISYPNVRFIDLICVSFKL